MSGNFFLGGRGVGVWILRLLYRNQPKDCQENRNVQGNLGKFGKLRSAKLTLCCPQFSSVAQLCPTLCDPMKKEHQASLSITNSQSSLRLMSTESVMPSSHLILCRPLLLLPPIPPSIRVFSYLEPVCCSMSSSNCCFLT